MERILSFPSRFVLGGFAAILAFIEAAAGLETGGIGLDGRLRSAVLPAARNDGL